MSYKSEGSGFAFDCLHYRFKLYSILQKKKNLKIRDLETLQLTLVSLTTA